MSSHFIRQHLGAVSDIFCAKIPAKICEDFGKIIAIQIMRNFFATASPSAHMVLDPDMGKVA